MKKVNVLVVGFLAAVGFSGCIKDNEPFDSEAQYQIEKPIIAEYVAATIPGAIFNEETGIWYRIITPGESGSYEYKIVNGQIEAPIVTVRFTGRLLNGTKFDEDQSEEGAQGSLANVPVIAWQIAFLPEIIDTQNIGGLTSEGLQKGAKIRFVTPSRWGYQNSPNGNIPANSPLDYEIEVLDIVPPGGGGN